MIQPNKAIQAELATWFSVLVQLATRPPADLRRWAYRHPRADVYENLDPFLQSLIY